ncbi:MAG: xanthine dehydrogenase family protein molybdopterin-binding subunit [Chloroflexota bacterium]|nr:xanthine dehydrogenase family protein molybdopterin-binding subunit [Chloroflexota bacterium]
MKDERGRTRVVRTRNEFEGEVMEQLALVQDEDAEAWPEGAQLGIVGRAHRRVEGAAKVTGRARYTHDVRLPGMLHARILRSPHPRARVRHVDPSRALALPGVRAVLHRFNTPKTAFRGEETIFREEVRFVGDEVAAVAADTEETADAALDLIVVDYEVLPHVVDLEEAIDDAAPRIDEKGNVHDADRHERGDVKKAFASADVVVEGTYRTSTQLHNCLETHGAVAAWDGDQLTVYESTQHVFGVRQGLHAALHLPLGKIRVLCDHMGGGFGSKGGIGKYTVIAALFARELGAPVRCVLDRREENVAAGNRSATLQRVKIAGKDGRITAIAHDSWSNVGQARWVADPTGPTKGLYDVPSILAHAHRVVTNTGSLAAFRAPGYVEGTFALESAIDELADGMGVDPLALRRHHAEGAIDPVSKMRYSLKRLVDCYDIGAAEIGWSRRKRGGLRGSAPGLRRGLGMASQLWSGGGTPPAYATVHLNPDGTAVVRIGTQDIGTGTRTVLAQVCAEELGIDVRDVRVEIGDTDSTYAPISAGSLTVASITPAVRLAAKDAREQLLDVAAGVLEVGRSELRVEGGALVSRGGRTPIAKVFEDLDNYTVIGKGSRSPNPDDLVLKTFGAHFAEVEVDRTTGAVLVERVVAVHDVGRIVNPLTARSQVEGGVIQALGFALSEERVVDKPTGRVLTRSLETYKVPTVRDVPRIVVRFVDVPDTAANNVGAKGLGEPPIIPAAAAVANAVANALGVRIRHLPLTRRRVLDALAAAS